MGMDMDLICGTLRNNGQLGNDMEIGRKLGNYMELGENWDTILKLGANWETIWKLGENWETIWKLILENDGRCSGEQNMWKRTRDLYTVYE